MIDLIAGFLAALAAIFVVLDPIGNVPVFHALNSKYPEKEKRKNIRTAIFIATLILVLFLFLGQSILNFFGVTIYGFKIAGGVILFIIGLKIVLGGDSNKEAGYSDIAIVPMATPLIAGPGTITTVMILTGTYGYFIPLAALIANLFVAFLMLMYADKIIKLIGKQGSEVMSKILGMILVAISVHMVISGLGGFLSPGILNLG